MQHLFLMKISRTNPWAWVLIWIGTIFFSSTSTAARWCEQGFRYVAALLFSDLRPNEGSYGVIYLIADKGFHVAMFLVLAILLWNAIPAGPWKIVKVLLFGAFIGSCSEFLQRFFPDRDPAIRDVLINAGGTAIGIAVSLMLARAGRAEYSYQSSPAEQETVLSSRE